MNKDSLKRLIVALTGVILTGLVSLLKLEGIDPALQREAMSNIAIIVGAYLAQSGIRAAVKDHAHGKNAPGVTKAIVPLFLIGLCLASGIATAAPVRRLVVFEDKTKALHAPIDGEVTAGPFALGTAINLGATWAHGTPQLSLGMDLFGELALAHAFGGELSLALGGGFLHPSGLTPRAAGSAGFLWAPSGDGPARTGVIVMGSIHDGGWTLKGGVSLSHLLF